MYYFKNCILIIVFNYSNCTSNKFFFKKIYERHFKKIIFYSDYPIVKDDNEINFIDIKRGYNTIKIFRVHIHLYTLWN